MRKKIEIAQFASGSWPDNIGDTTLFYSAGYSRHANDVSGLFLDNPPVLSSRYASVVWLYNQDVDKYILMHVQGSHIVNVALGRNYPFRAGYEVSREDMNQIGYSMRALFQQMPRIKGMPSGRVDAARFIDITPTQPSSEALRLSEHILKAIITGRQLYLPLTVLGDSNKCDGVLDSAELALLLEAIECLPLHLRRYATFGFCVDEHHQSVLGEALIIAYVSDSKIAIPADALRLSWRDALSTHSALSKEELHTLNAIQLPGEDRKLLTYSDFQKAFSIYDKPAEHLSADEWHIWLSLGHQLSDLHTTGWQAMRHYYNQMDSDTQQKYTEHLRPASLQWPIEDLDETLYGQMNYSEEEKAVLQQKALKYYLLSDGKQYRYLFGERGLTEEQKSLLDGPFLDSLRLQDRGSIERWLTIFEQQGRMGNNGVKKAFAQLYSTYIVPQLRTMSDIVSCMRRCPFIPARAFNKPDTITKPNQLDDLKEEHRALIEQWIDEAVGAIRFKHLDEVLHILYREQEKGASKQSIEAESLRRMPTEELRSLLKGKGKEEEIFDCCEQLLRVCKKLPANWNTFVQDTAIKACKQILFGGKNVARDEALWPSERIHDVTNWPKLGRLYDRYPHTALLIKDRVQQLGSHDSAGSTARQIVNTFSHAGKSKSKDAEETRTPYKNAEEAYPIIKTFLSTYKKQNSKMAKETEKIFKDLKRAKSDKQRSRRSWLNLVIGLVAGLLIGAGSILGYQLYNKPKATLTKNTQIILNNESDKNLMLHIASLNEWKSINEVVIDTAHVKDVNLDDINSLQALSEKYYPTADLEIREAKVLVHQNGKEGETKTDTLTFSASKPLLGQIYTTPYQIDQVLVNDSVKITIPAKELFGENASKLNTQDAGYYLSIIKYVGSKMPQEIDIAY